MFPKITDVPRILKHWSHNRNIWFLLSKHLSLVKKRMRGVLKVNVNNCGACGDAQCWEAGVQPVTRVGRTADVEVVASFLF